MLVPFIHVTGEIAKRYITVYLHLIHLLLVVLNKMTHICILNFVILCYDVLF